MKKYRIFTWLLCLALILQFPAYPVWAATDAADSSADGQSLVPSGVGIGTSDNTVTYGCHSIDARYPINGSEPMAAFTDSLILYEVSSDTLVYTCNPDVQMNPASLVKIMTALLALENCELDEVALCRSQALLQVAPGALVANFVDGEEVTVEQLLYTMMVGSCNDAALVLADHISGSQSGFVEKMNQRAAELGCKDTVFMNSTGLHHEQQVTTARDVVRILREAMKYPEFMEIFGTPNYLLPATNMSDARYFVTTNYMLSDEVYRFYTDSRITGGRTGTMDNGDYCFAATASIGDGIYIAVTMGTEIYYGLDGSQPLSHGSFYDTTLLLNLASKSSLVHVVDPEQIFDQLPVQGGDHHVVICTKEVVSCVLPPDYQTDLITTRTDMVNGTLTAPLKAGTKVADVQIWYGSICIAETELFTLIDVPVSASVTVEPNAQPGGFDAGAITTALAVLGIIFAVILVLFGGLFLVRTVRIYMRRARSKKRRKSRRRSK